jgi:bile acid-coenzyme A ligase
MSSPVSLGRRLSDLAADHPQRIAVVMANAASGVIHEHTFAELDRAANRCARLLAQRGIAQGAVVAIALPNSFDYFIANFACWKLGACVFPLRWDLPAWERDRLLAVAAPKLLIGGNTTAEAVPQLSRDELANGEALDDSPLPDVVPTPFRMNATGGSTGTPKIVVSRLPGAVVPDQVFGPNAAALRLAPFQVQLIAGPLYHFGPSSNAILGLMAGHTLVVLDGFDPRLTLALIERHRVQIGMLVPTMLYRLLELPEAANADFSHVLRLTIAGAKCADWLLRRAIDLFGGDHVWTGYGGTENIGTTTISGNEWLAHPGSVGRGLNTDIRILDDAGRELPPGEIGGIWMRITGLERPLFDYLGGVVPQVTTDGFSTLGDLGWLDGEGYLYIADRRTDMFVSGGANVYPAEVESVLLEHPEVVDVVVVGLPDDEWGARAHAILVVRDPRQPPADESFRHHCRERLARYKVPKAFEIVPTLPRDQLGKIRRSQLRDERATAG